MNLPQRVVPGAPIRASDQNLLIDAVRKLSAMSAKSSGFPRTNCGGESVPFEVSVTQRDGIYYIQNAPGYWNGRGINLPSRGIAPDYNFDKYGNPGNPWPAIEDETYDLFRIHACEWDIGNSLSSLTSEIFCVFVRAAVLGGGVLSEHPKIYMIRANNMDAIHEHLEIYTAMSIVAFVRFVAGDNNTTKTKIDQVLSSAFAYFCPPDATGPFRWYREDGTKNGFACYGGVLRMLPVRWRATNYRQGEPLNRPIEPEYSEFTTHMEWTSELPGTSLQFTDEEIALGLVIYLQVKAYDRTILSTEWIVRKLDWGKLSPKDPLIAGSPDSDIPATPDEPQLIRFFDVFSESDEAFCSKPYMDGKAEWSTCVPMAIIRYAGNSKIPVVHTIHSGVVDVRPLFEIHRNCTEDAITETNCEGAVIPGGSLIPTEGGASEGILQEFGKDSEDTGASTYALETAELAAASAYEAKD